MQVEPDRKKKSIARVLLLNASYEPMKIVSWQKALILWFQGKVEALEYHSVFARSVRASFQIPSVIRLKNYIRPKNLGKVRFSRENVYIRDNFTCQYCGQYFGHRVSIKILTLDHVVPASKSGPKSWTNVVAACRECNQKRANKSLHVAGMALLREPKAPSWLIAPELDVTFEKVSEKFPDTWLPYLQLKSG